MYTVTVKIICGETMVSLHRDEERIARNFPMARISAWKEQYGLSDEEVRVLVESANQQVEARKAEMRDAHHRIQPQRPESPLN